MSVRLGIYFGPDFIGMKITEKKGSPQGSPFPSFATKTYAADTPLGARTTFPACKQRVHTFTFVILPSITTRAT